MNVTVYYFPVVLRKIKYVTIITSMLFHAERQFIFRQNNIKDLIQLHNILN